MAREILMHINEELSATQQEELLKYFGNKPGGMHAHLQAQKPHLMFVAYDPEELCPHDLVSVAEEAGVHATLIDL